MPTLGNPAGVAQLRQRWWVLAVVQDRTRPGLALLFRRQSGQFPGHPFGGRNDTDRCQIHNNLGTLNQSVCVSITELPPSFAVLFERGEWTLVITW
jgi:hypothetical protein